MRAARAFVRRHGVVLQSARGPVPNLADAVAGAPIRGSWWGHPRGHDIFRAIREVRGSPDILTCRLIGGKVAFVHRRLWPALVRLAPVLGAASVAGIREEHLRSGAHRVVATPFPRWVPPAVLRASRRLTVAAAHRLLGPWSTPGHMLPRPRPRGRRQT